MIELRFGLWWAGSKLSYLRYLTFKTLRHFHPDSKIELFVNDQCKKKDYCWNVEKQDFENPEAIRKDYIDKLTDLNINIKHVDFFSQYLPNYQSDLFRWWYLKSYGGIYLDTDQIILKSFKTLPLDCDLIYSGYSAVSCGYYTPVGVIGASKQSEIVGEIVKILPRYIDPINYNSAGPFMFRDMLGQRKWKDNMVNTPSHYFYPVAESFDVFKIFNGSLNAPRESFALHWYGGSPSSQEFNKRYDEQFAKNSTDTISCLVREMGLL